MTKETIEVQAEEALMQRIKAAAAKHNIPVAEYCLEAIEQKLQNDDKPEGAENDVLLSPKKPDPTLIDDLRELRERILAERGGKPIDIDILEMIRSERDDELTGMR